MEHSELLEEVAARIRTMPEFKDAQVQIVDDIWEVSDAAGFPILALLDGGDSVVQPGKGQNLFEYGFTGVVLQKKMTGVPADSVVGSEEKPGAMKLKERTVNFLQAKENKVEPFHLVLYKGSPPKSPFDRLKIGGSDVSWKAFKMGYRKQKIIL